MNELRMYVEHLFQDRVLTEDMVELKEEIYGNLVARYEDYLCEGMSEDEAIAQAKASIADIDEVLDEVDGDEPAEAAAAAGDADGREEGAPEKPAAATSEGGAPAAPTRKKWPIVLGVVVGTVALLFVIGVVAWNMIAPSSVHEDFDDDVIENTVGHLGDYEIQSDSYGNAYASDGNGNSLEADVQGDLTVVGEWHDEVLQDLLASSYRDVAAYKGTSLSDAEAIENLTDALPMGGYVRSVDTTCGNGALELAYSIDDNVEDGSVDLALVYNAAAIFCTVDECTEVRVSLVEHDDRDDHDDHDEHDEIEHTDCYILTRENLEQRLGFALTGDLVTEDGWIKLKNKYIYLGDFCEDVLDAAEHAVS